MSLISLGLSEIQVGNIAQDGGEATSYSKIGKTYQNTCKLQQDSADVTEHFEEGQSAPEVRKKTKKVPVLTFSIMDPDPTFLAAYMGGSVSGEGDEAMWSWSDTDENNDQTAADHDSCRGSDCGSMHGRDTGANTGEQGDFRQIGRREPIFCRL